MDETNKNSSPKVFILGAVCVFLGFALAFTLFKFLTISRRPAAPAIAPSITQQIQEQPAQSQEIIEPALEELEVETAEVVEEEVPIPIVKEEVIEREIPKMVLNGIFASGTGSYCLINNRIVREGDTILGVKVVRIESNKVVLDAFGKEMILRVK